MPVTVNVQTRGGARLRAHLRAITSGKVRRRYVELVADGLRRELSPKMAAKTPKRSGRLAKGYSIRNTGDSILLQNRMPYTPRVRFTSENANRIGGARTPGELSARLSREIVPGLALRAARRGDSGGDAMNLWPFGKRETRAGSYTDSLTQLIANQASGTGLSQPAATAALEAASGVVSRAFGAAEVSGPTPVETALSPPLMALIGRELVRRGEVVFAIADETGGTRGYLLPVPRKDGGDETLDGFKGDLKVLKGGLSLVESQQENWSAQAGMGSRPDPKQWEPRRVGPRRRMHW